LRLCVLPAPELERFAHTGERFHAIPGV
jgi:hypothetical protein